MVFGKIVDLFACKACAQSDIVPSKEDDDSATCLGGSSIKENIKLSDDEEGFEDILTTTVPCSKARKSYKGENCLVSTVSSREEIELEIGATNADVNALNREKTPAIRSIQEACKKVIMRLRVEPSEKTEVKINETSLPFNVVSEAWENDATEEGEERVLIKSRKQKNENNHYIKKDQTEPAVGRYQDPEDELDALVKATLEWTDANYLVQEATASTLSIANIKTEEVPFDEQPSSSCASAGKSLKMPESGHGERETTPTTALVVEHDATQPTQTLNLLDKVPAIRDVRKRRKLTKDEKRKQFLTDLRNLSNKHISELTVNTDCSDDARSILGTNVDALEDDGLDTNLTAKGGCARVSIENVMTTLAEFSKGNIRWGAYDDDGIVDGPIEVHMSKNTDESLQKGFGAQAVINIEGATREVIRSGYDDGIDDASTISTKGSTFNRYYYRNV
jgi:hypothetical protein